MAPLIRWFNSWSIFLWGFLSLGFVLVCRCGRHCCAWLLHLCVSLWWGFSCCQSSLRAFFLSWGFKLATAPFGFSSSFIMLEEGCVLLHAEVRAMSFRYAYTFLFVWLADVKSSVKPHMDQEMTVWFSLIILQATLLIYTMFPTLAKLVFWWRSRWSAPCLNFAQMGEVAHLDPGWNLACHFLWTKCSPVQYPVASVTACLSLEIRRFFSLLVIQKKGKKKEKEKSKAKKLYFFSKSNNLFYSCSVVGKHLRSKLIL